MYMFSLTPYTRFRLLVHKYKCVSVTPIESTHQIISLHSLKKDPKLGNEWRISKTRFRVENVHNLLILIIPMGKCYKCYLISSCCMYDLLIFTPAPLKHGFLKQTFIDRIISNYYYPSN